MIYYIVGCVLGIFVGTFIAYHQVSHKIRDFKRNQIDACYRCTTDRELNQRNICDRCTRLMIDILNEDQVHKATFIRPTKSIQ